MSEKKFPRDIKIVRADGRPTWPIRVLGRDAYNNSTFDETEATAEEIVSSISCGLMKLEDAPKDANFRDYCIERALEIEHEGKVLRAILKATNPENAT